LTRKKYLHGWQAIWKITWVSNIYSRIEKGFFLITTIVLKEDRALRDLRFFRSGWSRKEKEVALEESKEIPFFLGGYFPEKIHSMQDFSFTRMFLEWKQRTRPGVFGYFLRQKVTGINK
jgi:hypothetical protein